MIRLSRPLNVLTITTVLLVASASVNVIQAQRIRSMVSASPFTSKLIGQTAPPLVGFSLAGMPWEQPLRGSLPTVVYYFSRTCKWCELNWPSVQALAAAAAGRYRVLAVSPDRDLANYVRAHEVRMDVMEGLTEQTRERYGFSGTPRTVVVSSGGLITHDWFGMFVQRNQRQIEDLFEVALPEITVPIIEHVGAR
jgi:hypothetical protein